LTYSQWPIDPRAPRTAHRAPRTTAHRASTAHLHLLLLLLGIVIVAVFLFLHVVKLCHTYIATKKRQRTNTKQQQSKKERRKTKATNNAKTECGVSHAWMSQPRTIEQYTDLRE
jgi:hypothetical protein